MKIHILPIACLLLVLLFVYTATGKLLDKEHKNDVGDNTNIG